MFNGLHDIGWSSMQHAYGTAEEVPEILLALRSPDADERDQALDQYYGAVHHQGDVYPCTTASLPFLYELAASSATADRAAIVDLLVSIGTNALAGTGTEPDGSEDEGCAGAVAVMRARAEVFVDLASDDDPGVRLAALPGIALFVDDTRPLLDRFSAATRVEERLVAVEALGTLALRVPALAAGTATWLAVLARDQGIEAEIRLAALAHRARCSPHRIDEDLIPTAIHLLDDTTPAWATPPLRTLHDALAGRVAERTALLTAQMRCPDFDARRNGIHLCADLARSWRGAHAALITLLGDQLGAAEDELAAEAAAVLQRCHPIAEPAREALAAYLDRHGPEGWASPLPHVRRACQEAAQALARLGDVRALPSLVLALDDDVDAWRAAQVAGALAADQLVPRLVERLSGTDLARQQEESEVLAMVNALAALGDPRALPVLVKILRSAIRHDRPFVACGALAALGRFGPAAVSALDVIRTLAESDRTRADAVAALWAVGGDSEEVLPLLHVVLREGSSFEICTAAEVLGEIGPPAVAAVPRLTELMAHDYEWVRIHAASALWAIVGDEAVLDTLLQAWQQNPATGNFVVSCLDRMGRAATRALPDLLAQLALPQRGGRFDDVKTDEELQRVGRVIIARLA